MPSAKDWRNPAPYDRAETLPTGSLAWEFLRRDDAYRRSYRAAVRRSPAAADRVAGRWGLRFRN